MAIKKAFQDLYNFLDANRSKKVETIMAEVENLCSSSRGGAGGAGTNFVKNEETGEITAIFDYYFKKWVHPAVVEFGAKKGSATGLNSMCKLGVSNWTKQNRLFKEGKSKLLEDVAAGEVAPADIPAAIEALEAEKNAIQPFPVPECVFDTPEELVAADLGAMQQAMEAYMLSQQEEEEAA